MLTLQPITGRKEMEKKRPGSSSGKSGASKGSSFSKPSRSSSPSKPSGFFSKPAHRPEPKREHTETRHSDDDLKERIRQKKAGAFDKPDHDPGIKDRPDQTGAGYIPASGTTDQYAEETSGGRGRGCCGSISGLMSLIAVLAAIVVIVLLVKCL